MEIVQRLGERNGVLSKLCLVSDMKKVGQALFFVDLVNK